MTIRRTAALVGAAMVSLAVPAAERSDPTFVFAKPGISSFWHTATNSTMALPIDFPEGATKASLAVNGDRYSRTYTDIVEQEFVLTLPAATSPKTENVYDLTLSFDDEAGTVRRAKLGLVESFSPGDTGTTRFQVPAEGAVWKRAVLPIPYGTTSFTLNGVETDTGLGGDQGWYALRGRSGETYSLSLVVDGVDYSASLMGYSDGAVVILK